MTTLTLGATYILGGSEATLIVVGQSFDRHGTPYPVAIVACPDLDPAPIKLRGDQTGHLFGPVEPVPHGWSAVGY